MSTADEKIAFAALRNGFRMPAAQSVKSRKTSITNAFVSTILPVVQSTCAE